MDERFGVGGRMVSLKAKVVVVVVVVRKRKLNVGTPINSRDPIHPNIG